MSNRNHDPKNKSRLYYLIALLAFFFGGTGVVGSVIGTDTVTPQQQTTAVVQQHQAESQAVQEEQYVQETVYRFRNEKLLEDHYKKHGIEMGFDSAESYETAATEIINHQDSLHRIEEEDGDDVYYLEECNGFVIVSVDGYIRTFFYPEDGIDYFNRQ